MLWLYCCNYTIVSITLADAKIYFCNMWLYFRSATIVSITLADVKIYFCNMWLYCCNATIVSITLADAKIYFCDIFRRCEEGVLTPEPAPNEVRLWKWLNIGFSLTMNLLTTFVENRLDGVGQKSIARFNTNRQQTMLNKSV